MPDVGKVGYYLSPCRALACTRSRAVRARKIRFKPIGWVSARGSGAQWTARPTPTLCLSVLAVKRSRARKSADGQDFGREAGSARPTPARSGLRALPYSLRLCCEGLEEKFLERGAPAPLSVRLKGRLSRRPESGTRRTAHSNRLGPSVAFRC